MTIYPTLKIKVAAFKAGLFLITEVGKNKARGFFQKGICTFSLC